MQKLRAVVELVRLVLGREKLGEAPPHLARGAAPASVGVLHVLFVSREPLGEEPPPPPREGRPLLRWILGREELPLDPEPQRPPRRSRREELPLDPEPPRAPRRSRLAALFAPERLDDGSL